jgi:anaerobic ribonucleoside-triphosphate reductase
VAKLRELPPHQRRIEEFFSERSFKGMPMVHTTDGFLLPWNKNRITDMLEKETQLSEKMFGIPSISDYYAEKIAVEVERRFKLTKPKWVSGSMIREVTNNLLLEWSDEVPEFQI